MVSTSQVIAVVAAIVTIITGIIGIAQHIGYNNKLPVIDSLTSDSLSPQSAGSEVFWTTKATDPDGDTIQYRFFLNGNPITDWSPQSFWVWSNTKANPSENHIEVCIRDGRHANTDSCDDFKTADFTIIDENQSVYDNWTVARYAVKWFDQANAFNRQGKYDEAIKAYDEAIRVIDDAIRRDPNYVPFREDKAAFLGVQGKYDEAIQAYDEAIQINPRDDTIWNAKGNALLLQGKYDEAIQAYGEVIQINPQEATAAWDGIGLALYNQGKYDAANTAYNEAIRLDPNNTQAWNDKGNALKSLNRTTEADDAFAKAKELVSRQY